MTDDAESIEPKAQLAKARETRRPSRNGVKLAVEPRELLRYLKLVEKILLKIWKTSRSPRQHWVFSWLCCCEVVC